MSRVHIVTDGSVRFTSSHYLRHYPVHIVPFQVRCGDIAVEETPCSEPVSLESFLEPGPEHLQVVPPSIDDFARLYEKLGTEYNQIISIHCSSALNGTYEHAYAASQRFLGRFDIQVIDSESISIGLGLLVQAAMEASARRESLENIVRLVRGKIANLYMVFFLDDLYYLERNHLVSRSQAILGNMLGIIPFLTMEDGQLVPMEKVRSRSRAIEKLIEFACEFTDVHQIGILQGELNPSAESRAMSDRLQALFPGQRIFIANYGPLVSTFVGPNSLGIVVLDAEEQET